MSSLTRRRFIAGAAALPLSGQSPRTRIVLLGTGGGPRPRKNSFATSQVVVVKNQAYVVDCGYGVANQLVRAGIALPSIRNIFITHHHSDHNAEYGNLLLLAWASGLKTRVDTWGPVPLSRMTRLFLEMNDYDIQTRIKDEGKVPLAPLIHVTELHKAGSVLQDDNVSVKCAVVDHPPVQPALAYRFDTADRSVVFSGDTRRSDALIELAKGANVLVHEAFYPAAVEKMAARVPNAATLRESIFSHHTAAADAGRVATAAGVTTLVLSHFVPPDDETVTDQMWIDGARTNFKGTIIVGKDLLEI